MYAHKDTRWHLVHMSQSPACTKALVQFVTTMLYHLTLQINQCPAPTSPVDPFQTGSALLQWTAHPFHLLHAAWRSNSGQKHAQPTNTTDTQCAESNNVNTVFHSRDQLPHVSRLTDNRAMSTSRVESVLLVTQHTLPHKHAGYTQHVITNSTHTHNTCTEHKWYALAITNSDPAAPFQWAAVYIGGGKMNSWYEDGQLAHAVNSEQHMHYIHLVIKTAFQWWVSPQEALSQSSQARALCIGAATHSPPQVYTTASEDCLLSVAIV